MKRFIIFVIIVLLLLCSCNRFIEDDSRKSTEISTTHREKEDNNDTPLKAVWISFYEVSMEQLGGGNKREFTKKADKMFSKISNIGMNTVFVHIRPFSDSFYPSTVFPWSELLTGVQGKNPGYDPLSILIDKAHEYSLKIHAWINPFRVSKENDLSALSNNNPARVWLEDNNDENDSYVFRFENGIYYNPSVPEVHALIFEGVREIIDNYDIDGIHMDDYFYPTVSASIDCTQFDYYCENGGSKKLAEWRRECVNSFVSSLYTLIKNKNSELTVSISPNADIDCNIDELYADVVEWSQNEGYTDYIIPQIYFGFNHPELPFIETADKWSELVTNSDIKLAFGLAQYKVGQIDRFAGDASNEWIEEKRMIEKQIEYIKKLPNYCGYVLFSYGYIS